MRLFSKISKLFNALIFIYMLSGILGACKSLDNGDTEGYWHDSKITTDVARLPSEYRGLTLDFQKLKNDIEKSNTVTIPLVNGNNVTVGLENSKTMSEELAKKFPDIKSYQIINTANVSGRIDINPSGFYAMIITTGNTYFINPLVKKGLEYVSYDKQNVMHDPNNPFIEKPLKP